MSWFYNVMLLVHHETMTCHNTNLVIHIGTEGCHDDIQWCCMSRQKCHQSSIVASLVSGSYRPKRTIPAKAFIADVIEE